MKKRERKKNKQKQREYMYNLTEIPQNTEGKKNHWKTVEEGAEMKQHELFFISALDSSPCSTRLTHCSVSQPLFCQTSSHFILLTLYWLFLGGIFSKFFKLTC